MVDCPGSGEALRLQRAHGPDRHREWAGACVDYLLTREDVDPDSRIGWPAGRSAATTHPAPRPSKSGSRSCVAWGANHDWGAVQRRRLEREGERPVPHYWEHVLWVWGHDDLETFIEFADGRQPRRRGRENHRARSSSAHGANDRQIPLEYARRSYEQAVNSPKRSCGYSPPRRAATEHIGLDHLPYVSTYIADWVADTFAELPR